MDEEIDFVTYVGKRINEIKESGKVVNVGIFSDADDYDDADDVDYDDGDTDDAEDIEL